MRKRPFLVRFAHCLLPLLGATAGAAEDGQWTMPAKDYAIGISCCDSINRGAFYRALWKTQIANHISPRRSAPVGLSNELGVRQLIPDRQLPDALAGGRKDRVTQRRRDRRHTGLTDSAERHRPVRLWHQMHADVARR